MSDSYLDAERDPVYEVAADWLLRLRQPNLSLEDTLGWQQWMEQDASHREAFRALEVVWGKFDAVPALERVAPESLRDDRYDGTVPVSAWKAAQSPAFWHRPRHWALAAVVLLALACVMVGSVLAPVLTAELSRDRAFETAVGENAVVQLSDGTEVQLGGHTRLTVSFGPHLREIDLAQGEAYFAVAKDPARPFLVRAGTATVTAVGTEFNVRRSDDRVVVSVLEGRVLVQPMASVLPIPWAPLSRAVGTAAPLDAGQRSTVNRRGIESTRSVADASSAVAWQRGRMAFEAEPLRYVVQDVNRYSDKPIVIADARTADLRVTGTVTEANVIGWLHSLESAFGIHADIQPDRIVLSQD
jgi:transmembrane sensor